MVNKSHACTCHNNNNLLLIFLHFFHKKYLVLLNKTISKGISSDYN